MYIVRTAAAIRYSSFVSDPLNAATAPWNAVTKLLGRPISCSARLMALTASWSEDPGATLNEMVAAGNCPRWVIKRGPERCSTCTIADSGTWPLEVDTDDGR